jgi:GTP-binding protein
VPPIIISLEQALKFIDNDELVEVALISTRIRKKLLIEDLRKQAERPTEA